MMSNSNVKNGDFKPMYLISAPTLDRYKRIEKLYLKHNKGKIGFGECICQKNKLQTFDPVLDPNITFNGSGGSKQVMKNTSSLSNKYKRPWQHLSPWYKIGESDLFIPGKQKR